MVNAQAHGLSTPYSVPCSTHVVIERGCRLNLCFLPSCDLVCLDTLPSSVLQTARSANDLCSITSKPKASNRTVLNTKTSSHSSQSPSAPPSAAPVAAPRHCPHVTPLRHQERRRGGRATGFAGAPARGSGRCGCCGPWDVPRPLQAARKGVRSFPTPWTPSKLVSLPECFGKWTKQIKPWRHKFIEAVFNIDLWGSGVGDSHVIPMIL